MQHAQQPGMQPPGLQQPGGYPSPGREEFPSSPEREPSYDRVPGLGPAQDYGARAPEYGAPRQSNPPPLEPQYQQPQPGFQPGAQAGYPGRGQAPVAGPAPQAAAIPAARDPELVEAGAQRSLAGFLVSYDGQELGVFWPFYQGPNMLGRKGAAPGLDIEIDHPTTSSRHAVLYASARPARLKIEDLGSTNGTFAQDRQLERGKKHEVRDGDVVRFGGFSVIVKLV
ncbi:MAG TPA: FHA domain-containing protein [Polyangiaceae bacterium]|nr:FHA domain-containing protein [Polyangiaceae bacterium]